MDTLLKISKKFPDCSILCIGDIMLDRFRYGEVTRISPEAPVPVLKITHERSMLGGVGNVAANASALGCKTKLLSVTGNDDEGCEIRGLLIMRNIQGYCHQSNIHTTTKTRHLTGNTHLLREDREDKLDLNPQERAKIKHQLDTLIPQADAILISDYNKGLLDLDLTQYVIQTATQHKKPVLVDPKGSDYHKYAGATLIKPNLKELSEISHKALSAETEEELSEVYIAANALRQKYKAQNIVVTLGHKGMLAVTEQQSLYMPTTAHEVFDVSGAGDTSLATLGAALATNTPLNQAIQLANIASGIVVAKSGTATISLDELQEHLQNHPTLPSLQNQGR